MSFKKLATLCSSLLSKRLGLSRGFSLSSAQRSGSQEPINALQPIPPQEYEIHLLEAMTWLRENEITSNVLERNSDVLDIRYVVGTTVDLGLAEWVVPQSPEIGESNVAEDAHSTAEPGTRRVLNTSYNWTVDLHPPEQLNSLPRKTTHSGNYEWLGPEPEGSPKYLWDSETSQTVRATADVLQQGYIAVSYTWGRFKNRYGPVDGTPWNVPVIKPDVFPNMLDELKRILRCIPASRYFWVDVLCINQDDMVQKTQEIAKQAAIFGGAKACLGYLWSLDSDDELAHVVTSFGDQLLWLFVLTSSDTRRASQLNGLDKLPPHIQERLDAKLRLDPWFTSLWALQETVLFPAQIWITRSGRFCTVNQSIFTTCFFAQALTIMNWAFRLRRQLWNAVIVSDYPRLSPLNASIASLDMLGIYRSEQSEAQALWEENATDEQKATMEGRVRDIRILNVMAGHEIRELPQLLQRKQFNEIMGSRTVKRWLDWGFGEASINISTEASRSAIIVAGVNRHTSKPRAEAMLAALKIVQLPPELNPSMTLTPGALLQWLQQTLIVFDSSMYFYVCHAWRSISEQRARSSPLYVEHDAFLAYDNVHNRAAPYVQATTSVYLTSMLPSTATRSFLPTEFTLTRYSAYHPSGWHIHREGVLHLPYGAPIQDIQPCDTEIMTLSSNGPEYEFHVELTRAIHFVQELNYVKDSYGKSCRVIFLPLLFIGDPTEGLSYGRSHTLCSRGIDPVVRGIILVSRPSNKRDHSMTFWSKAGLYSSTFCRVKPLEWQDGILVGSTLEESAVSRDKAFCDFTLLNKAHLFGPKVRPRYRDRD